jgi:hypothetical protein
VRDWTRARGPVVARVRELPGYVLSRRAYTRGRGVRFILHAEGRVANGRSNRVRVTPAPHQASSGKQCPEGLCRGEARRDHLQASQP